MGLVKRIKRSISHQHAYTCAHQVCAWMGVIGHDIYKVDIDERIWFIFYLGATPPIWFISPNAYFEIYFEHLLDKNYRRCMPQ